MGRSLISIVKNLVSTVNDIINQCLFIFKTQGHICLSLSVIKTILKIGPLRHHFSSIVGVYVVFKHNLIILKYETTDHYDIFQMIILLKMVPIHVKT